jgi:hypothetical protein
VTIAIVAGAPESGKTTFLGALWHVVNDADAQSALTILRLGEGDRTHLNQIANRWRQALVQDRTARVGMHLVSMELQTSDRKPVTLVFPDVPGEEFQEMWNTRECKPELAKLLSSGNVLLFIHADKIRKPRWIVDDIADHEHAGLERPDLPGERWNPNDSPTQVVLVELLQLLRTPPLDCGPRRLAIVLSAWDCAAGEGRSPQAYISEHLPLLAQYLEVNADAWTYHIYGLSAQGGEYDSTDPVAPPKPKAEELRNLDRPSDRIRLVDESTTSTDLTVPIAWLMHT